MREDIIENLSFWLPLVVAFATGVLVGVMVV